ncbi:MAG TPA: DUF1629 domain-containing protein [Allosphingosinicella sp.]|jgi:hypothetical protein
MTQTETDRSMLLEPSREPLFPPTLQEGGRYRYEPPLFPVAGVSGYSLIAMDGAAPSIGFDWVNEAVTSTPDPWLGRFEDLAEPPAWHTGMREPADLAEVMIGLVHTVSRRVLDVFLEFYAESVKYIKIDMRFSGEKSRQDYYWMFVTRSVAGIDYANSQVEYTWPKRSRPYTSRFGAVRLMEDICGCPFFTDKVVGSRTIFVSEAMVAAFTGLAPPLSHFAIRDVADPLGI